MGAVEVVFEKKKRLPFHIFKTNFVFRTRQSLASSPVAGNWALLFTKKCKLSSPLFFSLSYTSGSEDGRRTVEDGTAPQPLLAFFELTLSRQTPTERYCRDLHSTQFPPRQMTVAASVICVPAMTHT